MARPKLAGVDLHLHIDPHLRVMDDDRAKIYSGNKRQQKFLDWYNSQPVKSRTRMCFELLIAATNGELNVSIPMSMESEATDADRLALKELLANMVMEEE